MKLLAGLLTVVLGVTAAVASDGTTQYEQAYKTTKQVGSTVKEVYSQALKAYNYGREAYERISTAVRIFKSSHGLGKVTAALEELAQFGVIDQRGYSALLTILDTVSTVMELPSQASWPPDFVHGLPEYVRLGKRIYELYNEVTKAVADVDKVGINIPNQSVVEACLDGKLPKTLCSGVLYNPAVFGGGRNGVYSSMSNKDVRKRIKSSADAIASTSNVDSPKVVPDDEKEAVKAFNARNVLSISAALSRSYLPYGKEFAGKLPKELRPYYNFVATQQAAREAYIKGLRESLQVHYQKAIALKHLIEQVCDTPVETPPPACNGGGVFGALGSLSALAGLSLPNVEAFTGALEQMESVSSAVSGVIDGVSTGKTAKRVVKEVKRKSGYLPLTTRGCCCAPCTPAVHSAEAHISSQIASAQASINARITAAETALVNAIAVSTQQIVQAIQTENCLNRMRLKMEFDVLRGQHRLLYCTLLKVKLAELLVEIDSLDAQITATNAVLTQLQNENFELYDRERRRLEERGYELIKQAR